MTGLWQAIDNLDDGQVMLLALLAFAPVLAAVIGIYTAWFWLLDQLSRPRGDR